MSSESLNAAELDPLRAPTERVLLILKMRGPQTATSIGEALNVTGEAARQRLVRLAEAGLVSAKSIPTGVGRPSQFWELTPSGYARFPDTHADLTVRVLDIVREKLGPRALEIIVDTREAETKRAYAAAMEGLAGLRARVERLAALRSREGYMASWRQDDDGSFVLMEDHCPICAAATACQTLCRAELNVFRAILGKDAIVERSEHLLAGARRCVYTIRQASES
ncbi:transcriptional regulator [Roseiarcaceae bacterium H3SJ34-1]|uniref:helix-turn-helix transcriptional regulator n=1 Tax=Terripilifer ovatus TaxID=3032367 RepID=UPI003AB9B877|nr:transcriptional regulator [Roseiarcaceae bacterium H3SJ34-1]